MGEALQEYHDAALSQAAADFGELDTVLDDIGYDAERIFEEVLFLTGA